MMPVQQMEHPRVMPQGTRIKTPVDTFEALQNAPAYDSSATVLVVVGASGGVGKSTIALLSALLCARAGLDCALIETDAPFGDFDLWLGLDSEVPSLEVQDPDSPVYVQEHLGLYKAPRAPLPPADYERSVLQVLEHARRHNDVVIIDTPSSWTALNSSLVLKADRQLFFIDERPNSVVGAIKAIELCLRLGVPAVQTAVVYNRWNPKLKINTNDVKKALGCERLFCLPDGKDKVGIYLNSGTPGELISSSNPLVTEIENMLRILLPQFGGTFKMPSSRHKGGHFK